jgi:hypothetical protein
MRTEKLLEFGEVFPLTGFCPENGTSESRYQEIVNSPQYCLHRNIEGIRYVTGGHSSVIIGPLYYGPLEDGKRVLKHSGLESELLSRKPMVIGYSDFGLEYLSGFLDPQSDNPKYEMTLILPNSASLIFYHEIIKRALKEFLREK